MQFCCTVALELSYQDEYEEEEGLSPITQSEHCELAETCRQEAYDVTCPF